MAKLRMRGGRAASLGAVPMAEGTAPAMAAQETVLGWSLQSPRRRRRAVQHGSAGETDIPARYGHHLNCAYYKLPVFRYEFLRGKESSFITSGVTCQIVP